MKVYLSSIRDIKVDTYGDAYGIAAIVSKGNVKFCCFVFDEAPANMLAYLRVLVENADELKDIALHEDVDHITVGHGQIKDGVVSLDLGKATEVFRPRVLPYNPRLLARRPSSLTVMRCTCIPPSRNIIDTLWIWPRNLDMGSAIYLALVKTRDLPDFALYNLGYAACVMEYDDRFIFIDQVIRVERLFDRKPPRFETLMRRTHSLKVVTPITTLVKHLWPSEHLFYLWYGSGAWDLFMM